MDLSLFYFANDSTDVPEAGRYDLLMRGATFADEHGFTAVWTPERHFHPFGGLYPNPAVTGAAIAALTSRVQIRAGSVVAPLHDPIRIAEEWSVVDNISHGRVGVSFASGWHAVDFALNPDTFAQRRQLTFDAVDEVRNLWRGGTISRRDGAGNDTDVAIFPPPVQAELPVWVTAAGDIDTFRAAGRLGAGLLTHLWLQDVDELGEKIAAYRKALTDRPDHDGWPGHVTLMLHTYVGADSSSVRDLVRGPLCDWLKSSFHLVTRTMKGAIKGFDAARLSEADVDFLVNRSFGRYFDQSGLFGTVADAAAMVERVREVGVDEVACLIDFGLPTDDVITGLTYLSQLRQLVQGE